MTYFYTETPIDITFRNTNIQKNEIAGTLNTFDFLTPDIEQLPLQ